MDQSRNRRSGSIHPASDVFQFASLQMKQLDRLSLSLRQLHQSNRQLLQLFVPFRTFSG
jgi:hypothetical protein